VGRSKERHDTRFGQPVNRDFPVLARPVALAQERRSRRRDDFQQMEVFFHVAKIFPSAFSGLDNNVLAKQALRALSK
jgi:hypothetical protein